MKSVTCITLPLSNTRVPLQGMELFENPNWRLTKSLLLVLGLWPFRQTYFQTLLSLIAIISVISILIPELVKLITVWGNLSAVAECVPLFCLHSAAIVKMLSIYCNLYKFKMILEEIQKDWLSDTSPIEIRVLKDYGAFNRRLVSAYACVIFGCTIAIMGTPFAQIILDYVVPLNESRKIAFLYSVEYFVDPDKYKIAIFIHAYLVSLFPSLITVAFDTTYFHFVRHGCSIFAVIRNRMQMVLNRTSLEKYRNIADKQSHQLLVNLVKRHVVTLQYCDKLESLYTSTLLPVIAINTLALSVTGFHTLIKLNNPMEAFTYGLYACGCVIHLFVFTYTSQDLTDHSESIYQFTYDCEWYSMSPKLQTFFILMMIRSKKICKITACKIYIFSIENFGKVMKLSASYFTVLLSLQ